MRASRWAPVICIGLVLACGEGSSPMLEPDLTPEMARGSTTHGFAPNHAHALRTLARVLAQQFARVDQRQAIFAAIQASPLVESKLQGRAFLETAAGRGLLQGQAISNLPDLDIYIPHPAHRARWAPDQPLAVAALVDEVSPLVAYLPNGKSFTIDRFSSGPTPIAVLVLGPNELKLESGGGPVVAPQAQCDPEVTENCGGSGGGGGGGGGGGSNVTLRAPSIITVNTCDNAFCWEGNEFEMRAIASNSVVQSTWRCIDVPSTGTVNVAAAVGTTCQSLQVHSNAPPEVASVDVEFKETDGWPNGDDHYTDFLTPPLPSLWHVPHISGVDHVRGYDLYLYPDGSGWFSPYCPECPGPPEYVRVVFEW